MRRDLKTVLADIRDANFHGSFNMTEIMALTEAMKSISSSVSYYDLFGIEKNADETAINQQYRVMALKFHPDKTREPAGPKTEIFKLLQNAYETLSNAETRSAYDNDLSRPMPGRAAATEATSPLTEAVKNRRWDVVKQLLSEDGGRFDDINSIRFTLKAAAAENQPDIVKFICTCSAAWFIVNDIDEDVYKYIADNITTLVSLNPQKILFNDLIGFTGMLKHLNESQQKAVCETCKDELVSLINEYGMCITDFPTMIELSVLPKLVLNRLTVLLVEQAIKRYDNEKAGRLYVDEAKQAGLLATCSNGLFAWRSSGSKKIISKLKKAINEEFSDDRKREVIFQVLNKYSPAAGTHLEGILRKCSLIDDRKKPLEKLFCDVGSSRAGHSHHAP